MGMAVGILLATFLVIGEYSFKDFCPGPQKHELTRGSDFIGWAGAAQMATWAITKNIDHQ